MNISTPSPFVDLFSPITISQMDGMRLQKRLDTKFIFHSKELPVIFSQLDSRYKILEINKQRTFQYENLYFDTSHFYFYHQHHNRKLSRYKIRYRHYLVSNDCYLEVKKKNNKGITEKFRLKHDNSPSDFISHQGSKFLDDYVPVLPENISSKLWVYYSRITLADPVSHEKVTLDTNLFYRNHSSSHPLADIFIAEVKQPRNFKRSFFTELMFRNKHYPVSLSKYCLGTVLLNKNIKYNNFKRNFLIINNLKHGKHDTINF